ncbi:MAG: hypothetical protein LBR22_04920 [Desulfovibrio sp.]|jgi:hypothetical protein|nr:hypothetical protein [Desulfovibrio sp.]
MNNSELLEIAKASAAATIDKAVTGREVVTRKELVAVAASIGQKLSVGSLANRDTRNFGLAKIVLGREVAYDVHAVKAFLLGRIKPARKLDKSVASA